MMIVEHLQIVFAERGRKNSHYSLRSFARSLKMDSSTLSAILRGKRPLSAKMAQKILDELDFSDPKERERLLLSSFGPKQNKKTISYTELDLEKFTVISSWEHFALLALLEVEGVRGKPPVLASKLNLPLGIVMECLLRLEKLDLIERRDGVFHLTGKNLTTPTDVPSSALRRANKDYIEKALESQEQDALEHRDITGITMAIDPKKLPDAKRLIADFRRRLSSLLESGKKEQVYRLNVQLFPLTREKKK